MTVSNCVLKLAAPSPPFKGRAGTKRRLQLRSCFMLPRKSIHCRAFRVVIERGDVEETITVEEGSTILEAALDQGIELPHDCKMGVCMTCPARLVR